MSFQGKHRPFQSTLFLFAVHDRTAFTIRLNEVDFHPVLVFTRINRSYIRPHSTEKVFATNFELLPLRSVALELHTSQKRVQVTQYKPQFKHLNSLELQFHQP